MTDSQFEKAVETYGDTIFRVAYSYLKNRSDAEDVMQETLLKLYQEDGRFESEEHRKRWLIRVAVNQCKSTLRSTWLRRTVPLEEQTDTPVFDRPEQSELFDQVMALPKNYRLVVYLYYYEGYQAAEIGQILGIPTATVHTRLARGRTKLKELLGGYGYEQSV